MYIKNPHMNHYRAEVLRLEFLQFTLLIFQNMGIIW